MQQLRFRSLLFIGLLVVFLLLATLLFPSTTVDLRLSPVASTSSDNLRTIVVRSPSGHAAEAERTGRPPTRGKGTLAVDGGTDEPRDKQPPAYDPPLGTTAESGGATMATHTSTSPSMTLLAPPTAPTTISIALNSHVETLLPDSWGAVPSAHGTPRQFETVYRKIHCGALVRNFCMKSGQPRYFIKGKVPPTRGWATRMCNEATSKYRLNMVLEEPVSRPPFPLATANASSTGGGESSSSLSVLVAPFCWELYGYHLLLCLLATFTHLRSLGLVSPLLGGSLLPEVAVNPEGKPTQLLKLKWYVVMMRGTGSTPYFVGSAQEWDGATRRNAEVERSKASPSNYWALWRLLADNPADVWALPDIPSQCFDFGVLGGIPSTETTPVDNHFFRAAVWSRLGFTELANTPQKCGHYRVVVVERQKRYKIRNLDAIVTSVKNVFGEDHVTVQVVSWEQMSLREQLNVAVQTDVLIGVHGNGLSWSLVMPPGGSVVELWPNSPYNANYFNFALKANLAHFSVKGDGNCPQRCPASYETQDTLFKVKEHLDSVVCQGKPFNTTVTFFELEEQRKERKRAKKKNR